MSNHYNLRKDYNKLSVVVGRGIKKVEYFIFKTWVKFIFVG